MTTEAGRRLLANKWLTNPYGEAHGAMEEAVAAIEAEARRALLAEIRAEVVQVLRGRQRAAIFAILDRAEGETR